MDSVPTEMVTIDTIEVHLIDDVVATLQFRNIRKVDDAWGNTVTEVLVMIQVMRRLIGTMGEATVIELGLDRGLEIDITDAGTDTCMIVYADTIRDLIPALVLALLSTREIDIEAHTAPIVGQIKMITKECLMALMKIV